jgi:hypothetical protein
VSGLEWIMALTLGIIYIAALFTVAGLTFRKGRTLLGIAGIFFPLLWLIGAILPAKRGSRFDVEQAQLYQAQNREYTR